MHPHRRDPRSTTTDRIEQIAAMHAQHARRLERHVACRVYATPQTIEDACSFAWMQLIRHTSVNLDLPDPHAPALAWLSLTATREARSLEAKRAREHLVDDIVLERARWQREQVAPGAGDLAAQRARLQLVAEIPERPRRFMLRHALGYTYRELSGGRERQPHDDRQADRARKAVATRARRRRNAGTPPLWTHAGWLAAAATRGRLVCVS